MNGIRSSSTRPIQKQRKELNLDFWVQDIASPAFVSQRAGATVTIDDFGRLQIGDKIPRLTSPRSVEACLELGVDPVQLKPVCTEDYRESNVDSKIWMLKYQHAQNRRENLLQSLSILRSRIPETNVVNHFHERQGVISSLDVLAAAESTAVRQATARLLRHQDRQRRLNKVRLEELKKSMHSRKLLETKLHRENSNFQSREADMKEKEKYRIDNMYKMSMEEARAQRNAELERRRLMSETFKQQKAEREARERQDKLTKLEAKEAAVRQAKKVADWKERTRAIVKQQDARIRTKKNELLADERRREQLASQREENRRSTLAATATEFQYRLGRAKACAEVHNHERLIELHEREKKQNARMQQLNEYRHCEIKLEKMRNQEREGVRRRIKEEAQRIQSNRVARFLAESDIADRKAKEVTAANAFHRQMTLTERNLSFDDRRLRTEMNKKQEALHRFKLKQKIDRDSAKAEYIKEMKDRVRRRAVQTNIDAALTRREQKEEAEKFLHASYRSQATPSFISRSNSIYGQRIL